MTAASHHILVIKLGALGDFIQALGPMAAIRRHHPDSHITLLTTAPFAKLGEACGYFDDIWLDSRPRWSDLKEWWTLRARLQKADFSRVYDLQNNDRTSFYLRLFPLGKRPEWVGTARGSSHRNNDAARTAGLAFDGHVQTLAKAGIKDVEIDDLSWVKSDITRFNLKKPYILLVPGSAPQHPHKRWPAGYYAELATFLASHHIQPVILGTEADREPAEIISAACPEAANLVGQTALFDLAPLARDATAAIGNDTGPMHLIAPTGCPSWVLFSGETNPVRHAPKGPEVQWLQEDDLADLGIDQIKKMLGSLLDRLK